MSTFYDLETLTKMTGINVKAIVKVESSSLSLPSRCARITNNVPLASLANVHIFHFLYEQMSLPIALLSWSIGVDSDAILRFFYWLMRAVCVQLLFRVTTSQRTLYWLLEFTVTRVEKSARQSAHKSRWLQRLKEFIEKLIDCFAIRENIQVSSIKTSVFDRGLVSTSKWLQ